MKRYHVGHILIIMLSFAAVVVPVCTWSQTPGQATYTVKHCSDFKINGLGDNRAWQEAGWMQYTKIDSGGIDYPTKSKMLYSDSGIYVLFTGADTRITTKDYKDFEEIYEGDVYEVFFRPDRTKPHYFEYEINAMSKELILTLTRTGRKTLAWAPWYHEYKRAGLVQKATTVSGGDKQVGGVITGWTAEFFFPYQLLALLPGIAPRHGDTWDANLGRIDYDSGGQVQWSWSKAIKRDFHELEHFGKIVFE